MDKYRRWRNSPGTLCIEYRYIFPIYRVHSVMYKFQLVSESCIVSLMVLFGWNSNKFHAVWGVFRVVVCEKPQVYIRL